MLEYKTGDFGMAIWDSDNTDYQTFVSSLMSTCDKPSYINVSVMPFDEGTDEDKALKIMEEASEVRGALQYEGRESKALLYEICDTITACVNMAASLGYGQVDIQGMLENIKSSNQKRGRYDGR